MERKSRSIQPIENEWAESQNDYGSQLNGYPDRDELLRRKRQMATRVENDSSKENPISGVPATPVVAVPKVDVVGQYARKYESRTFANGGVVVISKQRPAEVAVNSTLRPNVDIIEVGDYPKGDYDLINRIHDQNQTALVNGVPQEGDKVALIGDKIREKGVKVMATHEQDERLVELAEQWGIQYPENIAAFRTLTTKSGLNSALAEYKAHHPNAHISAFGKNFNDADELEYEVASLADRGLGAYIKFDFAPRGQVNAGGEGQIALPRALSEEERYHKLREFVRQGEYGVDTPYTGVVQIALPNPKVLSMSSGQDEEGNYRIFEAHIQTQDGNTAAGAKPLQKDKYTQALLERIWPDMATFFREYGFTGRQNMNYLCIPDDILEHARVIYDNPDMEPVVGIDLNYRAITGTLNAMARYQEETGRKMDFTNFRSDGIKIDPFYAANPHLIYAAGKELGLHAGSEGNFAVINMGTFEPDQLTEKEYFKTQVIANGVRDAEKRIERLQEVLFEAPTAQRKQKFAEQGIRYVTPQMAGVLEPGSYTNFIKTNLTRVLNGRSPRRATYSSIEY